MKIILLVMMTCFPLLVVAQSKQSCCVVTSAQQMAMLSKNQQFINAHLLPLPSPFVPEHGNFVHFKTSDTLDGRAFEVKSAIPTDRVVLMFHEWWGLNEHIQQEAERLQKELGDVTVLVLDLYDGKVTNSREEAAQLMNTVSMERATNIIKGALEHIGANARIGTIGWCFGGSWSLQGALIAGKQTAACVIYYGMPEFDVERLTTLNAPVLGIFAKQDEWITTAKVKEFERAMKQAKKNLKVKMYDAVHAFANPSNPKYDTKAAADAYKHSIQFFKKHLLQVK